LPEIVLTPSERRSDNHARAALRMWSDPAFRAKNSARRRAAWLAGKYDAQRGHRKSSRFSRAVSRMRELRAEGLCYRSISERLGCCLETVRKYARGGRMHPPRYDVSVIAVQRLRAEGLSWYAIARRFGCSERTIRNRFRGLQPQRSR